MGNERVLSFLKSGAANTYIHALCASACAALAGWVYLFGFQFRWEALAVCAVFALVCALARRFPMDFGRVSVELVDVAVLASLVLLGPMWALAVAAPSMLYRERLRTAFSAATHTLIIVAGGVILFWFMPEPLIFSGVFEASVVYGFMAASFAYYALDALINSALLRVKYSTPIIHTLRESMLPLIPANIIAVLAALGTAYVMVAFGPAAALVLFAGAAAALISLHLIHKYQRESEDLRKANADLLASSVNFAAGMVAAVGAKDGYTARLAAASSVFAGDVGREFGLPEERVERLRVAALLQDVGMVGVPDEVFMAPPEKLNSVGRMALERHAAEGERILSGAPGFGEAAKWVRWHHERVDGTGYPDRLKGQWIPLEARILAAATNYSARILAAPQSSALTPHEARMELTGLSGRSLDAEVVKALLRVLDREDENYAAASDERFAFSAPSKSDGGDTSASLRIV